MSKSDKKKKKKHQVSEKDAVRIARMEEAVASERRRSEHLEKRLKEAEARLDRVLQEIERPDNGMDLLQLQAQIAEEQEALAAREMLETSLLQIEMQANAEAALSSAPAPTPPRRIEAVQLPEAPTPVKKVQAPAAPAASTEELQAAQLAIESAESRATHSSEQVKRLAEELAAARAEQIRVSNELRALKAKFEVYDAAPAVVEAPPQLAPDTTEPEVSPFDEPSSEVERGLTALREEHGDSLELSHEIEDAYSESLAEVEDAHSFAETSPSTEPLVLDEPEADEEETDAPAPIEEFEEPAPEASSEDEGDEEDELIAALESWGERPMGTAVEAEAEKAADEPEEQEQDLEAALTAWGESPDSDDSEVTRTPEPLEDELVDTLSGLVAPEDSTADAEAVDTADDEPSDELSAALEDFAPPAETSEAEAKEAEEGSLEDAWLNAFGVDGAESESEPEPELDAAPTEDDEDGITEDIHRGADNILDADAPEIDPLFEPSPAVDSEIREEQESALDTVPVPEPEELFDPAPVSDLETPPAEPAPELDEEFPFEEAPVDDVQPEDEATAPELEPEAVEPDEAPVEEAEAEEDEFEAPASQVETIFDEDLEETQPSQSDIETEFDTEADDTLLAEPETVLADDDTETVAPDEEEAEPETLLTEDAIDDDTETLVPEQTEAEPEPVPDVEPEKEASGLEVDMLESMEEPSDDRILDALSDAPSILDQQDELDDEPEPPKATGVLGRLEEAAEARARVLEEESPDVAEAEELVPEPDASEDFAAETPAEPELDEDAEEAFEPAPMDDGISAIRAAVQRQKEARDEPEAVQAEEPEAEPEAPEPAVPVEREDRRKSMASALQRFMGP